MRLISRGWFFFAIAIEEFYIRDLIINPRESVIDGDLYFDCLSAAHTMY